MENTHEGIVSKDTFEKVQKIRNKNKADTVFMRYKTNLKKDPVNRYENLVYRKNTDEQLYRRYRMTTQSNKNRLYTHRQGEQVHTSRHKLQEQS